MISQNPQDEKTQVEADAVDNNNGQPLESKSQLELAQEAIVGDLARISPSTDLYATEFVDKLLKFAVDVGTSDVHLQPTLNGFEIKFRSDGVLQQLGEFPLGASSSVVSRLKVLSNLLTYRSDIPQEGRVASPKDGSEIRVSTYPTLHGERAALRFFGNDRTFHSLADLGHTPEVSQAIRDTLDETSGAMLVTGPAGSGKSTTLFACLRHIVGSELGTRSIVTLEDPVEVPIPGTAQSQVNNAAGFDLHTGLRSLLRQDPEVIMIGEVRDRVSAEISIQACLTGQLMLTTYHADSAATAVSRLLEMGIEPYLLRSGVIGILSQRLLRTLCECARSSDDPKDFYGLPVDSVKIPAGCEKCNGFGYRGRTMASEFLSLKDSSLASAVLDNRDSREIYRIAIDSGMESLWARATNLVREGVTSPREVRRVLGVSMRV